MESCATLKSDHYKAYKDTSNDYIYLDPTGGPHEFTLIFLHGMAWDVTLNISTTFSTKVLL